MKIKRILSVLTAASIMSAFIPSVNSAAFDAKSYSYRVFPILEGLNEYYFVKTDNPDPRSFTFVDKDTKYNDGDFQFTRSTYEFADINYEDTATLRVDGGYIFDGCGSDGGTLELRINNNPGYYYSTWEDTDISFTVPKAVDYIDYLIDTYAVHDDFFENMSSIQSGLQSISRYSGSYIRGELSRTPDKYWGVSAYNHVDQYFYIYSPYTRTNSKSLFASFIYPYCCDSLGFPSLLSRAAQRIEPTAEIKWDSYNHYIINITYNGTTKSYGGQGSGEGQGITADKIIKYFRFGKATDTVNLAEARQLLVDYSAIEMEDDIPSEDKLTWKQICDTVDDGSWTKVYGGYSYLFKDKSNDIKEDYFYADDFGVGHSIYWGGSLGFASDTWVDGRYVNINEVYVPGEKLEDHTDASVILYNAPYPEVTYKTNYTYNYQTGGYVINYYDVKVTYTPKTLKLIYSDDEECWFPLNNDKYIWDRLINEGAIDSSYFDCIRYTMDDLKAMGVDRNTDIAPECGYIYDQTVEPGTAFGTFGGSSSEVRNGFLLVKKKGGTQVVKLNSVKPEIIDSMSDDTDTLSHYINATVSDTSSDCFVMSEAQMKAIEYVLSAE